MYLLWVFLKRGFLRQVSYRLAFALGIVNFIVGVVSFFYLSRLIQAGNNQLLANYGNNAAAFLVVGTTFNLFVGVSLRAVAGQIQNDQSVGVLEHILMGQVGLTRLAIYSALYDFVFSAALASVSLVLLSVVFHVPLAVNSAALVIFMLNVLGVGGLGLLSAGVILVTKQGDPVAVMLGLLAGFLSGVYYPLEVLPGWLAAVGYILPTTYGLRALRQALINNASLSDLGGDVGVLLGFVLVSVPLGLWSFHLGFNRARQEGTLSHY